MRELKEETDLDAEVIEGVCVFENLGREEHLFLVTEFEGVPKLGTPELAAQTPDNTYELIWVELDALQGVNLKPERLKKTISSLDETP